MRPWWDDPAQEASLQGDRPVLMPGGRNAALARLNRRIKGFTPEWRDLSDDDAGVALVRLFGVQLDPLLARIERLPDKALRAFLSTAGISLSSPRAARTRVRFVPRENNNKAVSIPEGFRLRSAPSDDREGDVTWETVAPLNVTNCRLTETVLHDAELSLAVAEGEAFVPLADAAKVGSALYLGFQGHGDLSGELALGIITSRETSPSPVSSGGPEALQPQPRLVWEYLSVNGFKSLRVEADDTAQLMQDGIIRLAIPRDWSTGRPAETLDGDPLYWLRLRLASGAISGSRQLASILPHVVGAEARETFRDEYPLAEGNGLAKQARLAHAPVISGSIVLEVDEGAAPTDVFALPSEHGPEGAGSWRRWEEVDTLVGAGPEARVFTLDPLTGVLSFGDNRNGAALPPGIRGVVVRSYATTAGGGGNVAIGAVDRMVTNVSALDSVANIDPGVGGAGTEPVEEAEARGPGEIKARGRAVTTADIRLLAAETPGANILRAFALSGVDPAYPGAQIPGTVGVFVLARRHPSEPVDEPPLASSLVLRAVADHIAKGVGPVGARVCASNPAYQTVGIEATIALRAGADADAVSNAVRTAIDRWLSPETSNPVYGMMSLGQTLRHADLNHLVLNADPAVIAAPYLAFRIDGVLRDACMDAQLRPYALPWPGDHRLQMEIGEVPA